MSLKTHAYCETSITNDLLNENRKLPLQYSGVFDQLREINRLEKFALLMYTLPIKISTRYFNFKCFGVEGVQSSTGTVCHLRAFLFQYTIKKTKALKNTIDYYIFFYKPLFQ